MSEELLKSIDSDIATIPANALRASDDRERAIKLLVHAFLRLWTRFALESGSRLRLSPSQFTIGNYSGKMNWTLNETVDFKTISRLELGGRFGRRHMLVAETYVTKGEGKARVFFSLEEEQVRSQPVFVSYLVYDAPLKDFNLNDMFSSLKPALPSWLETVVKKTDAPLWEYCREELECVGV